MKAPEDLEPLAQEKSSRMCLAFCIRCDRWQSIAMISTCKRMAARVSRFRLLSASLQIRKSVAPNARAMRNVSMTEENYWSRWKKSRSNADFHASMSTICFFLVLSILPCLFTMYVKTTNASCFTKIHVSMTRSLRTQRRRFGKKNAHGVFRNGPSRLYV